MIYIISMLLLMFSSMLIQDMQGGVVTSLYLLCCILRIVKIKDLANTIVAALFYPVEAFTKCSGGKVNGYISDHDFMSESQGQDNDNLAKNNTECLTVNVPNSSSSSDFHPESVIMLNNCSSSNLALR